MLTCWTTGGSTPVGRSCCAWLILAEMAAAARFGSNPPLNMIWMVERLAALVELMKSMPSTSDTACSSGVVTERSIKSALPPGSVVLTTTIGTSNFGR